MSNDELLDLVNENDEVIGEVWRTQANADPKLIHREVGVVLYDDQNRLLFQQRSLNKKVHPGNWTMAALGHIGKGGNPEDFAHQELQEELGFDTPLTFWEKQLIALPNETHFTYWYMGKYTGQKITIQTSEVQQTHFVSQSESDLFVSTHQVGPYTQGRMKKFWEIHNGR
jgi:isopentenyldiphosphate isomerase